MWNGMIKKDIKKAKRHISLLNNYRATDETTSILREVARLDKNDMKFVMKEDLEKK